MAAPYNVILSKCEKAIKAWLATRSIGTTNIYTGKRSLDKAAPSVIVYAEKATEYPRNSGHYNVTVHIFVKSDMAGPENDTQATTQEDAHDTLVAKTFDSMKVYDTVTANYLADQISALVSDFTVYNVGETGGEDVEAGADEDVWQDKMTLTLYCCNADIT